MRRADPVKELRPRHTPEVAKLVRAAERLGERADSCNGIIAGMIVPGSERNSQMLAWVLKIPMDCLRQRRANIELSAKRMRKLIEGVLEQDDLDWPVTAEEEQERKAVLEG